MPLIPILLTAGVFGGVVYMTGEAADKAGKAVLYAGGVYLGWRILKRIN